MWQPGWEGSLGGRWIHVYIWPSPFAAVTVSTSLTGYPWTVAYQAPLSMGFPRQEYWSGLPFLPPGDLPNPGTEPTSPVSPALAGDSTTEPPTPI